MPFVGFVELDGSLVSSILVTSSSVPINADAYPTYRVYGAGGFIETGTCTFRDNGTVTNASNATPIVLTSQSHGLTTGSVVTVVDVGGNTAANGTFVVTKVDNNNFSLDGSAGNGPWTSGGTWNTTGVYKYTVSALGTSGYAQGSAYQVLFSYNISAAKNAQLQSFMVE